MKTILTVLFSLSAAVALLGLGWIGGYLYESSQTLPPEVKVITVEVPVERIVTQEVEKVVEVVVTPTPAPTQAPPPTPTPEPVVAQLTQPVQQVQQVQQACVDKAWVVSQPISDLQAAALEVGQGKRLRFRIRNDGDCIWEGYVLSSDGVLPDIPMPLTYPGEIADFSYDFVVYTPFEARFHIQPTEEAMLLLANSASPGVGLETIYYRLDVVRPRLILPGYGGAQWRQGGCVGSG